MRKQQKNGSLKVKYAHTVDVQKSGCVQKPNIQVFGFYY